MQKVSEGQFISIFKIAATYIGTVVGAGFASGQEVLQFFVHYGVSGYWGILLAAILFGFYGWMILVLGMKLGADSHLEVIYHSSGKILGRGIDYVITFFLFGAFTAMAAGAGAIFAEQFNLPSAAGSAVMVVISLITVMMGLNGVINSISLIVPILLATVVGIGMWNFFGTGFYTNPVIPDIPGRGAVPYWPFSALVYVSYNIVMSVAILAPLGKKYNRPELLSWGAGLGAAGLGFGALAIFMALVPNLPEAARYQIPMIHVSGGLNPVLRIIYSLVLLAEIYTTAVGNLYGLTARVTTFESPRVRYYLIGTTAAAFAASLLGFTSLVRTLYPAVGYAGLLLLVSLTYTVLIKRKQISPDQN